MIVKTRNEGNRKDLKRRFGAAPLPAIERRPGARFYVTARSGNRTAALLGPYISHMTALDNVRRGEALARTAFPAEAAFATFGTASAPRTIRTRFGR
jgi:hypothetical protein